jgi:tetratricopeptide (TPR) repeat protein/tRNA A-37 threonylcarbamoyl transferase component Bud32
LGPRSLLSTVEDILGSRYAFLEVAGRGQASVVCKVADRLAGDEIKAAKVYRFTKAEREARREEISHEFLLGSRFDHPNLVRYMDLHLERDADHALVTMEYLPGPVLNLGKKRLDVETAAVVFLQLLRALGALHEAGFVHGDVKPSNVWCRIDGDAPRLKLLDYHLTYRKTEVTGNTSRGTLRYLAPEAISGDDVDERADLYAAGVFFYELLRGRPLFTGAPHDLARMHLTASVPKLELKDPRGDALDDYLAKLLAKKSVARYRSAPEAANELIRMLGLPDSAENSETLIARVRSVPVIGREEAIDKIHAFLSAESPAMSMLRVIGTGGVGKSRIVRECLRVAQSQGALGVRFDNLDGAETIADQLESALGVRASPKTRGLASLPGAPAYGALGLSPRMLARLNRLSEKIAERSRSRTILLACDDAQRAAADGVQALLFLMRALRDCPVLWCVASLPDGLASPLQQELRKAGSPVTEIFLSELGLPARKALIAAALPKNTAVGLIDEIVGLCGGAPSALLRRTEHLIRCGALKSGDDGALRLDAAVAAAQAEALGAGAADWLKEAPPEVRSAAEMLAVVGGEVGLDLLAEAVGADPVALRRLMASDDVAPFLSFRETQNATLVRFQQYESYRLILDPLPGDRRSAVHDRFADVLSLHPEEARWRIARHRLLGRAPLSGVRLVVDALASGAPASVSESASILDLALSLAEGEERTIIAEARADMAVALGDAQSAEKAYREILALQKIELERRLRAIRKLALACVRLQRVAEALDMLRDALATPGIDDFQKEKAEVYLAMAIAHSNESRHDEAKACCEAAVSIGETLADDSLVGRALTLLGKSHSNSGSLPNASATLITALKRLRRSRDAAATGKALVELGHVAVLRNKSARALGFLERASEAFRSAGRLEDAAQVFLSMGSNHQRQCEWDKALERYDEALRLYRLAGHVNGQAATLGNEAHVCTSSGRLEQAIQFAREALGLCRNNAYLKTQVTHRLAYAQFQLGLIDEASANVDALIEEAESASLDISLESGHRLAGEIAALRNDWGRALAHFDGAYQIVARSGRRMSESTCLARLAEASLGAQRKDAALEISERALRLARETGSERVLAQALLAKGKVHLAFGDNEKALETLKEAERLFVKGWVWEDIFAVSLHLARLCRARGSLKFASYYLRSAADVVDHVLAQMRSGEAKKVFMDDPRRRELRHEAQALREAVERGASYENA